MSNAQFIAEVEKIIQIIPHDNNEEWEALKRAIECLRSQIIV